MWNNIRSLLKPQFLGLNVRTLAESVLSKKGYSTGSFPALGRLPASANFLQPWRRESNEDIVSSNPNNVSVFVASRGMKIKGRVKRRCKDCEMEWKDGVLYNFCPTFPRHKQMMVQQYWENLRIRTHASQSVKKPYYFRAPRIPEQTWADYTYQYPGRNPRVKPLKPSKQ